MFFIEIDCLAVVAVKSNRTFNFILSIIHFLSHALTHTHIRSIILVFYVKLAGIIYHGNQSSTSSDLSPMSEQKSLPRRGRSRYHQHNNTTYTTPRHRNLSSEILSSPLHHNTNNPSDATQQATLLTSSPPRNASYLKKSNYSRMSSQFKPIQHRTIYTTTHQ